VSKPWVTASLSDVSRVFTDGDWIESKDQSPSGIRLIQTGNVGIGEFKYRAEKARYISPDTFRRLRCEEIFEGDCLISRLPDPVGRACIIPASDERLITAVDCTIVRFDAKRIVPEFFKYFSQSTVYLAEVEVACTGATRKRISRNRLGNIALPLPSIPEQKRIVAILDEAFEGINAVVANTEKNLANARHLFDIFLSAAFKRSDSGWTEKRIEDLCLVGDGNHSSKYPKNSEMVLEGVPFIRSTNISNGSISWDDMLHISEEKHKDLKKGHLRTGDVLFTNRGEIGKVAIVDKTFDGANLNSQIAWLRCKDEILPSYLFFYLTSADMKNHFEIIKSGTALQQFTIKMLKEVSICFPCVSEQNRIVTRLTNMSGKAEAIELLYRKKLTNLAELKQAILHKAFAGELTARPEKALPEAAE
jgi:type I restriction enzyme, S subunit